jgi:hypothetical protein
MILRPRGQSVGNALTISYHSILVGEVAAIPFQLVASRPGTSRLIPGRLRE